MITYTIKPVLYLFLLISLLSYSQESTTIKVIDQEDKFVLPKVTIISLSTKDSIHTNYNGSSQTLSSGTYLFKKDGYISKHQSINNSEVQIIELQKNPAQLNEVIINSNQMPSKLKKSVNSLSLISTNDIMLGNNVDLSQTLNRASGIFMQSGALNTNRLTIRGIGSRNLFGTAKIRAYFKDIPLTNGSGETSIEDFELGAISKFEIIKGAGSTTYGAGLGGTIHITPKNGLFNKAKLTSELSAGSFGLLKGIIGFSYGSKKEDINALYSNTHSDGYRDNNNYNRQTFTFSSNHFLNKSNQISLLFSYVDLKAFIPSSLNEDDYLNNPESAAFQWKSAKGHEDFKRGIIGLSWEHDYSLKTKQITSLFSSLKDAYEARPFNILEENTKALGIRTKIVSELKLFEDTINYAIGFEVFNDQYKHQTFQNLYQDFPPGTGSVKGDALSNFKEQRYYYNIFLDSNYAINPNTTLVFGINMNQTFFNLEDRFPTSPENPDQSGDFKFDIIASPKFGISHLITNNISLYSNISHGFSPISLEETLLPNGLINNNIKPETGWNYELGTRGTLFNNKLNFQASIFRMDVKNLLVPRRTDSDEFIGINAGRTQHDGLELNLGYNIVNTHTVTLDSFLSYTLNAFTFKEFIDDDADYSENDLTGVPSEVFNLGLVCNFQVGIYANINYQYVGEIPITDSNNLYSNSYKLSNCKVGFQRNLNKNLNVNVFFGINNIFDETYASQLLINASGFGGNAPRYYYPGNPKNYYGGLNLAYEF
ncbi:TonB-dependent receptor family protein [Algibacter mikhailovii]|uniref:TonB-dependent receptor family protein n=1 Tax=Algibacter mikhailovii TaxID=425498 RepID=UPI0024948A88|nr:TonB-dependent receptor [Algibacter mikhailovii]